MLCNQFWTTAGGTLCNQFWIVAETEGHYVTVVWRQEKDGEAAKIKVFCCWSIHLFFFYNWLFYQTLVNWPVHTYWNKLALMIAFIQYTSFSWGYGLVVACWILDQKIVGSTSIRNSRRIFFSTVYFLCWLFFLYLFHPPSPSYCSSMKKTPVVLPEMQVAVCT